MNWKRSLLFVVAFVLYITANIMVLMSSWNHWTAAKNEKSGYELYMDARFVSSTDKAAKFALSDQEYCVVDLEVDQTIGVLQKLYSRPGSQICIFPSHYDYLERCAVGEGILFVLLVFQCLFSLFETRYQLYQCMQWHHHNPPTIEPESDTSENGNKKQQAGV